MNTITMAAVEGTRSKANGAAERSQMDAFLSGNPASTGVLAGVVTMAGQIAAQFEMPGLGCRITALFFAFLLAYYQVGVAQRRPVRESMFLVPIVAVIIFTGGWGANGLLYEANRMKGATEASAPAPELRSEAQPSADRLALLEWIADQVIPSANAQSSNQSGRTNRQSRGGWKKW